MPEGFWNSRMGASSPDPVKDREGNLDGKHDSQNGSDDSPGYEANHGPIDLVEVEMKYKILVLVCASMIAFGSHFSGVSFGSLKSMLVKDGGPFQLTNQQYGAVQASNDVLNVFLPLFGGFLLDLYGTGWGSLSVTVIVTVGNILSALGLASRSYGLLLTSRLIYGVGSGAVNIVQQMVVAHWFTGKQLASAMAFVLMVNRLGAALGNAVVLPASKGKGNEANGMYISAGISIVSLLFNALYIVVVRRLMLQRGYSLQKQAAKKPFTPKALFYFPGVFWLIMLVHCCTAGIMNSFLGISTDFFKMRNNEKSIVANYKGTMSLVITAVVYLVLGPLVDRFGQRILLSTISTLILVPFFVLLEWTKFNSYVLMVFFAISIPFKALASLAAIPIIIPYGHMGTAFAVYKCVNAIGSTISDSLAGVIQHNSPKNDYTGVMVYFVVMSSIALVGNLVWWWIDHRKFGDLLQKNNAEREAYMAEKRQKELEAEAANEDITKQERFHIRRTLYTTVFIIMFNAAWILYLYTTITGNDRKVDKLRKAANAPKPGGASADESKK